MNELSYLDFDPDLDASAAVSAYDEVPLWLGAHVHGVDPWRAALARAGEKIARRAISNVTLHDASGAGMPFGDESFDLIVSNLGVNNFDALLERGGFAVSRVVERTTNSGFSERGRRSWPDRKRPFFRACRRGSIPMCGRGAISP